MNIAMKAFLMILGLHLGCCHMMLTELLQRFMREKQHLKGVFFSCFSHTGFDEVSVKFKGCQEFSTLDINMTFLHITVMEEPSKILTINTHRRLFHVHCFIFGFAPTPALWQSYIAKNLKTPGVTIVHVNIIVRAEKKAEHIQTSEKDQFLLSKRLSMAGVHLNLISFSEFSTEKLQAIYHSLGIVLYLDCYGSSQLLLQASNQKLFSRLHHWLLLTTRGFQDEDILRIPLDSHVTLAQLMSDEVLLQDIYRIAPGMSLTYTPPQSWHEGQKLPCSLQRDDLQGATINVGIILTSGKLSDFMNPKYQHIDTTSKATFKLLLYISKRLNFRINITTTNSEGYLSEGSACYDGLVGLLQCGDSEIGTGLPWKEEYLDVIDYAAHAFKSRGSFMFLKPSLSDVSILYILPFSTSVWLTILCFMVVLTIVRILSQVVEDNGFVQDWKILCSDAIIDTIGIICDQGTSSEEIPDNLTSRLVLFLLLLLSVFLLTSYSAIIVSLLQTSSNAINTLPELLNSSLQIGMSNVLANVTSDPTVMNLLNKKLQIQTSKEIFLSEEEGMQRIRGELYAFHGTTAAYKIISDKYLQHEKCRFKMVKLFENDQIHLVIRKDSPYQELIKQSALWLKEIGLISWEEQCWYFQKPKCESNSQSFVSVSIHDFYPVLIILGFGAVISVVVLLLEMLHSRQKHYKRVKHQHKE